MPLVVFSHGIGGSRRGYSYLGQHWASHGVASLHLQHIGSDRNVWFGNPLGMIGRLQAAIVLSAPPFYGEPDPATILAPVTVPTLHVTATGDVIRIPGYYSGAEDRVAVFEATGSAAKALAVFDGGSHSMFTDLPAPGDPGEVRRNQPIARVEAGSAPGRTITSWREAAHHGEVQR